MPDAILPPAGTLLPPVAELLPPVAELLPHRGRAVLLGRVLAHDAKTTVCSVDAGAGALFRDASGRVPAYVGLEYMAQAIAAHGALLERNREPDAELSAEPAEKPAKQSPGPTLKLSQDLSREVAQGPAEPALSTPAVGVAAAPSEDAVHAGKPAPHGPRPGFFVGTRRLALGVDAFDAGQALEVTVRHVRGTTGLLAFDCAIRAVAGGEPMVSGVLTVYLLESFEALIEGFSADD